MATLFENISKEFLLENITPRTEKSSQWFKNKLQLMSGINRQELLLSPEFKQRGQLIVQRPLIGTMHMFKYLPKGEETLPYYDQYPLVIITGRAKGGFRGLNLHYLPVMLRVRFLTLLYDVMQVSDEMDHDNELDWDRLNRGTLKRFLKPMIKTYLTKQVRGRIAQVFPPEWEIAAFLPFQRFRKSNRDIVWRDSYKQVYRR